MHHFVKIYGGEGGGGGAEKVYQPNLIQNNFREMAKCQRTSQCARCNELNKLLRLNLSQNKFAFSQPKRKQKRQRKKNHEFLFKKKQTNHHTYTHWQCQRFTMQTKSLNGSFCALFESLNCMPHHDGQIRDVGAKKYYNFK